MSRSHDPHLSLADHDRIRRWLLQTAATSPYRGRMYDDDPSMEQMVLEDELIERTGYARRTVRKAINAFRGQYSFARGSDGLYESDVLASDKRGWHTPLDGLFLRVLHETARLSGIVTVMVYEADDLLGSEGEKKWVNAYYCETWFSDAKGVLPTLGMTNWGLPTWEWRREHIEDAPKRGRFWATVLFRHDVEMQVPPGWTRLHTSDVTVREGIERNFDDPKDEVIKPASALSGLLGLWGMR